MRQKRKVVISVHGINTDGAWQKKIASTISQQGWVYYPLHYGKFGPLRFCASCERKAKVEWFRDEFESIKQQIAPIKPSVIAHSFGTFIVSKALEKYDFIKLDKLILCGAIVPRAFDWQKLLERKQITTIRNDSGGQDFWAGICGKIIRGTGSSGKYGFTQSHERLIDNHSAYLKHSDYLKTDFCEAHWIPFLENNVPYLDGTIGPYAEEESISPIEAARWSALTYFRQFVLRALSAVQQKQIFPVKNSAIPLNQLNAQGGIDANGVVVVIPETPNDAKEGAIELFSSGLGLQNVNIGSSPRTIKLGSDGYLYDIPSILNSLILLDHRQNEELRPAIIEFHRSLVKHIDSLGLLERAKVRTVKLKDLIVTP